MTTEGGSNALVELPPDPLHVQLEPHRSNQVMVTWSVPKEGLGATSDRLNAEIRHSSKTDGSGTWPNSSLPLSLRPTRSTQSCRNYRVNTSSGSSTTRTRKAQPVRSVIHTLTDSAAALILEDREDSDTRVPTA